MVLLASARAVAAPIVVDPNATACVTPSVHFTTIQQAIDAAPVGATVQVCPGQYQEQISIYKPLTLKGVGAGSGWVPTIRLPAGFVTNVVLYGWPSVAQVLVQSQNVTLTNLVIDGSNTLDTCSNLYLAGIVYESGASGAVRRASVRNQFVHDSGSGTDCRMGIGIFAQGGSVLTVQDSDISSIDCLGVSNDQSSVNVKTSVISVRGGAEVGVNFANNASGTISGNFVSGGEVGIGGWFVTGDVTIANNIISKFTRDGITCNGCNGVTVSENKVYGDGPNGIFFMSCSGGNLIQSNQITGSSHQGIFVDCPASDTITLNILQDLPYGITALPGDVVTKNKFYNVGTNIRTAQ